VSAPARPFGKLRYFIAAMRPNQWTKNGVVLAAFFFAFWDRYHAGLAELGDLAKAVPAFLLFCLASSAVYLMNDIRDVEADKHHPLKKNRPIASGKISRSEAGIVSVLLLAAALVGASYLSLHFLYTMTAYVLVQLIYTFALKKIALVDVMVIAGGFVLRAIAGAVVLPDAQASPWLLICTFLLALFLGLCKRRHEKLFLEKDDSVQRPALEQYDAKLLDQLIAVTSGATIVSYAIYTFWPETVEKFGTHALGFTVPFVIFGIFRYLDLVYRHDKGDRPEKILLTDIPLLVSVGLYGLCVLGILIFL
jgi:4-hydroxybenzoate polyprenyltransferase